jgi:transposase-like protein
VKAAATWISPWVSTPTVTPVSCCGILLEAILTLSPTSILRLKQEWEDEYRLWRGRPLTERYVYIFADGLYLKAGLEKEKTAMLIVIGVRADGHKELLAMEEGYRESTVSWAQVLRGLRDRGLAEAPLVTVADGALGLWAALETSTRRPVVSAAGITAP